MSATARSRSTSPTEADFWFDPACPWAWLTSRWMLEVEQVRPVTTRFHVMSLAILNRNRDLPEEYLARIEKALGPVRVCAAAAAAEGPDVLRPLYTAMGARIHPGGEGLGVEMIAGALADCGLDANLVDVATTTEWDDAVEASHLDGIGRVGTDVGTPIITVNGASIFGPVVTPAPKGEAAGRLWDGVVLVTGTPGFYELKRSRDQRPTFD